MEVFDGADKRVFFKALKKADVSKGDHDFTWDGNISSLFPGLQATLDALVAADRKIVSAFSDEAAERRYWQIEGFAKVPCGGTHLKRTGEIGAVTLKRKNPGKGKERIEIYLGEG